jgi:hypothetical protein
MLFDGEGVIAAMLQHCFPMMPVFDGCYVMRSKTWPLAQDMNGEFQISCCFCNRSRISLRCKPLPPHPSMLLLLLPPPPPLLLQPSAAGSLPLIRSPAAST